MKVVAVISARMASKRFPGKVMAKILGRPILSLLIERVKMARYLDEIVVATTTNAEDDVVADLAKQESVKTFRGSETDVLGRILVAVKECGGDIVVRLTGDNPLTDPAYIDKGIKLFLSGRYDYVANDNIELTMPRGMDVEVFSVNNLDKINRITKNTDDREHVTRFFYQHPKMFRLKAFGPDNKISIANLHLAVDTKQDLEFVREIFEEIYPKNSNFGYQAIINFLNKVHKLKLTS